MADQLFPVPFHGDTVVLVDHDGQPFVAMKPVVENLGLDWKTQHAKLTDKFASTMGIIPTVGEDGRQREMVCLPLRKLPAFLYSINPNKVAPALRDKIVAYQAECDEALWQYWTQGTVVRPAPATARDRLALQKQARQLLLDMDRCKSPFVRQGLLDLLRATNDQLGLTTPDLALLPAPEPVDAPMVQAMRLLLTTVRHDTLPVRHVLEQDDGVKILWLRTTELFGWLAMPSLQSERAFSRSLRSYALLRPNVVERQINGQRVSNLAGLVLPAVDAFVTGHAGEV